MAIQLARNLSLPIDAQTQTFAILAIRGVGKTYACLKMAEGFHDHGLQFVFVDPTGVAWGLRSSADGKKPGLPVMIFGGERGDIPLEESSGQLVADFVVDEGVSCVLDLSDLRKGQSTKFMTDFAERLYHNKRRKRDALHIFLDEADAFAPQRPRPNQARMLGAIEDLVRRGRSRGIGLTLATQRSAVLNKDVLTQCETLVAMCNVAPQDRKAVDEWLKAAGDEKKRVEIMTALASLDQGEAFIWSPRFLKVLKKIKVAKRVTFDSSSTPKPGTKAKQPKTRADIDLDAVRKRMSSTVERAAANDPRRLHTQIRDLTKQLEKKPAPVAQVGATPDEVQSAVSAAVATAVNARDHEWAEHLKGVGNNPPPIHVDMVPKAWAPTRTSRIDTKKPNRSNAPQRLPARSPSAAQDGISPARQRILDALRFLEDVGITPADRTQLALFADTSPKSSGYANNLGAMRTSGLIDYPGGGTVVLTAEGRSAANNDNPISTTEELHEALRAKLPNAKWRIIQALVSAFPGSLTREVLAQECEISASSSGFANNLGSLRSLRLIDYPQRGSVSAEHVLFLNA